MTSAVLLLAAVTVERLAELWFASRNTKALLARGAHEVGGDHYPCIVTLHATWLVGLWLIARHAPVDPVWLALFLVLQVWRAWILLTLGRRWTTRIIVLPGSSLVTKGPYRLMPHPNYVVVVGEIAVLPLCLGLPWYALAFTVLNAAVLTIRIRAESAALADFRNASRMS